MWEELRSMENLSDFEYFYPKFEDIWNWAKFCMFLAPKIFFWGGGGPLEILDLIFKILSTTDHGAKFRANRLMELRDTVVNK